MSDDEKPVEPPSDSIPEEEKVEQRAEIIPASEPVQFEEDEEEDESDEGNELLFIAELFKGILGPIADAEKLKAVEATKQAQIKAKAATDMGRFKYEERRETLSVEKAGLEMSHQRQVLVLRFTIGFASFFPIVVMVAGFMELIPFSTAALIVTSLFGGGGFVITMLKLLNKGE